MLTIASEINVGDLALLIVAGCAVIVTFACCVALLRNRSRNLPRLRIAVRLARRKTG